MACVAIKVLGVGGADTEFKDFIHLKKIIKKINKENKVDLYLGQLC